MNGKGISRRDFVSNVTTTAVAATLVPRSVHGEPAQVRRGDRLNVAIVGAGGMGMSNAEELTSENIVALCDVDFAFVDRQLAERMKEKDRSYRTEQEKQERIAKLDRLQAAYAKAKRYADFREMLERQKDIEAVVIATPDHTHAVIANTAMQLGKHVYVQKPLTHSVHEARVLLETAKKARVVTQMGNQGHSTDEARRINEWIQAGVIGPVHEVHIWTNRPIWPQGIPRPAGRYSPPRVTTAAAGAAAPANAAASVGPAVAASLLGSGQPAGSAQQIRPQEDRWNRARVSEELATAMASRDYPVPQGLNWDLYLGPAPEVPYHPVYHPFNWRGWVDFGVGALGDMAAHLLDHPYWALDLGYPTSIEATSSPWGGPADQPATYPQAMTVHYQFPARGNRGPVRLYWYDGGLMPPRPEVLPFDMQFPRDGGVLYLGEKGILIHENYGRNPRILPEPLLEVAFQVPRTMPRVEETHELNWARAAKGIGKATSPFEYAAPLTEVMLLGLVALRAGQGRKIYYDAQLMKVTNLADANAFLKREYRKGWSL
jgi:predicted dehydrogenase